MAVAPSLGAPVWSIAKASRRRSRPIDRSGTAPRCRKRSPDATSLASRATHANPSGRKGTSRRRRAREKSDQCAGPDNADNVSALSGFRICHQPSTVGPSSSPSLHLRCYPQGAPETLLSLHDQRRSGVDATHAGERLGCAQRAGSRVRSPRADQTTMDSAQSALSVRRPTRKPDGPPGRGP